jgi:signal transduction histidine kinase
MTPVLVWRRLLVTTGCAALLLLAVAAAAELLLIGRTNVAAREHGIDELRAEVVAVDMALGAVARGLAGRSEVRGGMDGDRPAARRLFEVLEDVSIAEGRPDLAITVYDARGTPRAWNGRGASLSRGLVGFRPAGFVDVGQAGLRLVRVEPVVEAAPESTVRRLGVVVVEQVLSVVRTEGADRGPFVLETSVGRVRAGPTGQGMTGAAVDRFTVDGADGRVLLDATMSLGDVAETRARWREAVWSLLWLLVSCALLAATGLVLVIRVPARYLRTFWFAAASIMGAWGALWFAATPGRFSLAMVSPGIYTSARAPMLLRTAVDLLVASAALAGLVVLVADLVNRWRWHGRPGRGGEGSEVARVVLWSLGCASGAALLLGVQDLLVRDTVAGVRVDLMHTAIVPIDTARAAIQLALVLATAAIIWAVSLLIGAVAAAWPVAWPRWRWWWLGALAVTTAAVASLAAPMPTSPALLIMGAALGLAWRWRRLMTWFRHADPLARSLVVPAAVMLSVPPLYVGLVDATDRERRRVIEDDYAGLTADHPYDLQNQLAQTQGQIDAIPDLAGLAAPGADADLARQLDTDRAFGIWQQTALASSRLTSSVELYDAAGELTSRFAFNIPEALNIPDYALNTTQWSGQGCDWLVFGEVAPFGSEERRTLHAERAICALTPDGGAATLGGVVVHVAQVDYESLSFISPRSPYVELLRAGITDALPSAPGHGVELVIYGWGLQPTFVSGRSAWPLDEALFQRSYESRTPFWTRLHKDGLDYEVHVINDRAGIYALGYPVHTSFDHLLHLSELASLVIITFGVLLAAVVVGGLLSPGLRRLLPWREVRARFALKLQLWFLGVAAVPVIVIAFFIQGYLADQLRADVEAGAARTVTLARSVIEESAALQPVEGRVVAPFSDEVLVWISQVVGEDVNIFQGAELLATSERDLYASGLLPTRTPEQVYRAVYLDQLPSFVGEDSIGDLRYQLAAAPVPMVGQDAILTVPLASRQQEIESQIEEVNRRIWASTLFFVGLVGVVGWGIARSIADPVRRLTRATSRVAQGEFTTPASPHRVNLLKRRVAEQSADELDILEADFTKMAQELETQRRQLERTHRLEAWSEMARQVAHEIKNPLTPVQLNAEHLRRVHADKGAPLSPVLEGCVTAILKQVRILRQIASEFSSYASSPKAEPEETDLETLLQEIVSPYRQGLEGRIEVVVRVPPSLPLLILDRLLIQRALINIIENALHAMPSEGRLSIEVETAAAQIELSVSDTGVGLEPEALARIFEPYFSTKVTGTGLGMAIAKRNIELNGGKIAVTSEAGQGTQVAVTLPSRPLVEVASAMVSATEA